MADSMGPQPGKNKRVRCPACDRDVAVYSSGRVRTHGWSTEAAGPNKPCQRIQWTAGCKGSGEVVQIGEEARGYTEKEWLEIIKDNEAHFAPA